MKLVRNLDELPELPGSVVTDGMFDGLHLGHQQILQQVAHESKKLNLPSVLVTYWPHPRHILSPKAEKLQLLTSLQEKAELVEQQGIDYMLVLKFDHRFGQISHVDFVTDILHKKLRVKKLIIGYDHRFGKNRLGDVSYLAEAGIQFGFDVIQIGKQEVEDIAVSSTKIRYSLKNHLIEYAAHFLGRPYAILASVVEGDQRGRTIGYPTANLLPDEELKLIPADGVYATRVWLNGVPYSSMTNIGVRPTVGGGLRRIETHIIDFAGNIYGKMLKLEFIAPIRSEMKFESLEELKQQLDHDKEMALKLLF